MLYHDNIHESSKDRLGAEGSNMKGKVERVAYLKNSSCCFNRFWISFLISWFARYNGV